jgi:hypothetical protein
MTTNQRKDIWSSSSILLSFDPNQLNKHDDLDETISMKQEKMDWNNHGATVQT